MQNAKKKKKTSLHCLIKSKGSRYLTNHLWVTFIMRQLIFIVPNFSWPNCFRQQPIFIGLSENDHYLSSKADLNSLSGYLGCFVECFYFVWCEAVCSCQECSGEGGAVPVSPRWAVSPAKVASRMAIGWGVVVNVKVMSSSEYRAIWGVKIYGICSAWTVFPCLRQFNRCPSWLVYQWK